MQRKYVIVAAIVISLQLYILYSAVHKQCVTENTSNNKAGTLPQVNTNYHRGKVNSKYANSWFRTDETIQQCDQNRVTQFFNENPEYAKGSNKVSTKFYNVVKRAVDTFERLDMPYFIAYGTLLGWYRECGFIKHTTDVDFGMPIEDAYRDKDLIIRELAKVGIIYTHSWGNKEIGFELKFKDNETNSRMDIFAFYHEWVEEDHEQKERLYSSVWNYQYFTRKLVFPLTEFTRVNLSGIITRAPKNTEEWLRNLYGPQWFSPKSEYHYWTSPLFADEINTQKNVEPNTEKLFGNNLLINPSFEEVTLEPSSKRFGWNVANCNSWSTNEEEYKHGKRSIELSNEKKVKSTLKQNIKVTGRNDILISGWSKPLTPTNKAIYDSIDYGLKVTGFHKDGKSSGEWRHFDYRNDAWQYRSFIYKPKGDLVSLTIELFFHLEGSVVVDNMSVRVKGTCATKCINGECINGECQCFKGWSGSDCNGIVEL